MSQDKIGVMFVCLGNICRSPMGEIVFRQMVIDQGVADRFDVASAGTAGYHVGDQPDPRTLKICRKFLGDGMPRTPGARQLCSQDFLERDYILCMDGDNLRNAMKIKPSMCRARVQALNAFDGDQEGDVQDPYYGDESDFEHIFHQITRACEGLLIKALHSDS